MVAVGAAPLVDRRAQNDDRRPQGASGHRRQAPGPRARLLRRGPGVERVGHHDGRALRHARRGLRRQAEGRRVSGPVVRRFAGHRHEQPLLPGRQAPVSRRGRRVLVRQARRRRTPVRAIARRRRSRKNGDRHLAAGRCLAVFARALGASPHFFAISPRRGGAAHEPDRQPGHEPRPRQRPDVPLRQPVLEPRLSGLAASGRPQRGHSRTPRHYRRT